MVGLFHCRARSKGEHRAEGCQKAKLTVWCWEAGTGEEASRDRRAKAAPGTLQPVPLPNSTFSVTISARKPLTSTAPPWSSHLYRALSPAKSTAQIKGHMWRLYHRKTQEQMQPAGRGCDRGESALSIFLCPQSFYV